MTAEPPLKADLRRFAEALQVRGVNRFIYFHTDHFEPWVVIKDAAPVCQQNAQRVVEFADRMDRLFMARKLTLFYKCHLPRASRRSADSIWLDDADPIGFRRLSDAETAIARNVMTHLDRNTAHEIQVHLHHEQFTFNSRYTLPALRDAFTEEKRERDSARLDLALRLSLDQIAREIGRPVTDWLFVHGNWALNASDPEICQVNDEIQILMKNGCIADFTFPAGVGAINPSTKFPFFCRPLAEARCYDLAAAEPEPAFGRRDLIKTKFFIWSSTIEHKSSSLDYFSPAVRRKMENLGGWLLEVAEQSVVAGGRLYCKTHAHSLHSAYFGERRQAIFPLEHPGIQGLFEAIAEGCESADIPLEFATANDVLAMVTAEVDGAVRSRQEPARIVVRGGEIGPAGVGPERGAAGLSDPSADGDVDEALSARVPARSPVPPPDYQAIAHFVVETIAALRSSHTDDELGLDRSRLAKLGPKKLFHACDKAVIDFVRAEVPRHCTVIQPMCGIGQLCLALASMGKKAIGIEPSRGLALVLRTLREKSGYGHLEFRSGRFPHMLDFAEFWDDPEVPVVMTNCTGSYFAQQQDKLIQFLSLFRHFVIDLGHFGTFVPEEADRLQLLHRFETQGRWRIERVFESRIHDLRAFSAIE